ncbi:GNAT family N-acetyltransferase [Anaerocolumna sp. AGMB13020]|uniref:GNAT family N-acetyltransferase n=1 Tax=Anaerocolumna sp. AGMB13020 TaxID=3081750 RepID=UPI0029536E4D|nr:GNAT family N-acetyltransferase [Anaerocolumna sp. AGMB13020]WOO35938.1 GNAT family N-acetyltransferase [Anaerocolumna sp. AGMB13020]
MKKIETERLIIRPIKESDYEDICEYGTDEEIGKYMIYWPKTRETIKTFIKECEVAAMQETPGWREYAIQLKSSLKVIGNVSLIISKNDITAAEIGWISNKDYWGRGYMSEAVNCIIQDTFQNTPICKILATCTEKNIASLKVMEKSGMHRILIEQNQKAIKNGEEVSYTKLTYCITKN